MNFSVFPRDLRALGLPMRARAGNALGEMAPVRWRKRACMRMRAGRDHVRAGFDQLAARGKNPLPPGRRSRFDDHQHVRGQLPELSQNRLPGRGDKFVQDIGQTDKVARSAIDCLSGGIGNAPGDAR